MANQDWWLAASRGETNQRVVVELSALAGAASANIYPADSLFNLVLTAKPGGGGTLRFEYTFDSYADIEAASNDWTAWEEGDVAAITHKLMDHGPTAIRVFATTVAGGGIVTGTRSR